MSEFMVLRATAFEAARPTVRRRGREDRPQAVEAKVTVEDLAGRARAEVERDPEVLAVARSFPTRLIRPVKAEAPAGAEDSWGLGEVGADASGRTGAGVVVAVLDTGIDKDHAAFAGVDLLEQDFSSDGDGDVDGHGTHCAGTILGRDVAGRRIGVARGVERALIGKVLRNDGSGDSEMLFRGIQWAVDQGADILSMSLGFDFPGFAARLMAKGYPEELAVAIALDGYRSNLRMFDSLMDMIRANQAFRPKGLVVAATGNESRVDERPDFRISASVPAAAFSIVSVAAVERSGAALSVAPFSNGLPTLSAPGVDIVSARAGGRPADGAGQFLSLSGTSMACPHVAGLAALWWEAELGGRGNLVEKVKAQLIASARTDRLAPGFSGDDFGYGVATAPA